MKHDFKGFIINIQLNSAKTFFIQGVFSHFVVCDHPGGWIIELHFKDSALSVAHLVDARNHEERVFKSIDAALKTAREIGFSFYRLTSC